MQSRNRPFLYMPILLFKAGEKTALRCLAEDVRGKVLPLIELVPRPQNCDEEGHPVVPQPMRLYLKDCAKDLRDCWGPTVEVAIDTFYIEDEVGQELEGQTALEFFFEELRFMGVRGVPVISPSMDRVRLDMVKNLVAMDQRGVCVRIRTYLWEDRAIDESFASTIMELITTLNLPPEEVDLVFDAKDITNDCFEIEKSCIRKLINNIPRIDAWRSLTFASCAFPQSLAKFDDHEVHSFPRLDWKLWRELSSECGRMERLLFGDYGINFPLQAATSHGGGAHTTAQIRYATEEEWICPKGTFINNYIVMGELRRSGAGIGQYRELAQKLVQHPKFKNKKFSHGDAVIVLIAEARHNPGNPQIWRGIGANHHITLVVRQLEGRVSS